MRPAPRRPRLAAFAAFVIAGAAATGGVGLAPRPASAQGYALPAEDKALVDKAAAYLQELATVSGRFTQISPDGSSSTGEIDLQRPGKARFQYDAPARVVIVSDGRTVGLYDGRLNTFSKAPLSRTPLNLLLAQHVRLDRGVVIARVDKNREGFALTALDAHHQADGRIVIYFADRPMALRGWNLTDGQGRTTQVRLGDLRPRTNLDPELFMLRDARKAAP